MHCAGSTINATCILCCVQVLSRSTPRGYWTPMYTYCVQWERPQRLHQQFRCDLGHCDAFNGAMVCLQCPGAPQTVHSAAGAACITLLHVPIPVRAPVHIGHTMPVPVLLVYMYMYMYMYHQKAPAALELFQPREATTIEKVKWAELLREVREIRTSATRRWPRPRSVAMGK